MTLIHFLVLKVSDTKMTKNKILYIISYFVVIIISSLLTRKKKFSEFEIVIKFQKIENQLKFLIKN